MKTSFSVSSSSSLSPAGKLMLNVGELGSISSTCLRTAFTQTGPKKRKKLLDLTVLFALLGSACVKADRKIMVKLTLGGVGCLTLRSREARINWLY